MWGFLRETKEIAEKAGIDPSTGLERTGLDIYLKEIFPSVDDWEHDKIIGHGLRIRPDYRNDDLKLIVEFDGIQHYTNPLQIIKDFENTKKYEALSYKVVRIPYFIQLSKTAVKTLFGIDTHDLFDDKIPSLSTKSKNTPAFLCPQGIIRMASDFLKFPEQYKSNIDALKKEDETLSGVKYLEDAYLRLSEGNC